MTLQEAIVARHSVRQYIEKPIEAEKIQQLQTLIDECNREGGLHIQLVTEEPNAFAGGMAKYGKFRGVRNYIAMICKKGDDVKLGYYGEKVILLAQTLGLNTCWVGLSFRKQPDQYKVDDGETLVCVVSLGYGANQGVQHPQKRTLADVTDDRRTADHGKPFPAWFGRGVEAALLAPTAVNQQCLSCTTATVWRPSQSSPSSATHALTSVSPNATSRSARGKGVLSGRKLNLSAYHTDRRRNFSHWTNPSNNRILSL